MNDVRTGGRRLLPYAHRSSRPSLMFVFKSVLGVFSTIIGWTCSA